MNSMKAAIFPNFQRQNALECAMEVCDILHSSNMEVWVDNNYKKDFVDKEFVKFGIFDEFVKEVDFVIAIGGDGTILKCANHVMDCRTKLLGINTGRLGFISAIESNQLDFLKKLATGDYSVSNRMMIDCYIPYENKVYTALNDITITGMYSGICDFTIFDEYGSIGEYRADGAIFSTPTGSTAYSLSAGGPIIDPDMECIEMTLICPHSIFSRPMVFPPTKKICFQTSQRNRQSIFVSVDGALSVTLTNGDFVEIRRSNNKVKIINMNDYSFYNSLDSKMMRTAR